VNPGAGEVEAVSTFYKVCSKIVVGGSHVVHGLRFDQGVLRIVVVCYIVNHYV
jgi:hypothetical protein